MKTIFFLFAFLLSTALSSFCQWTDSFQNSTLDPSWVGCRSCFVVNSGGLQSALTTENTTFFISRPIQIDHGIDASFDFNLDFKTSSANYVELWIAANDSNLLNANGYFFRLGGSKDEITFVYRQEQEEYLIAQGPQNITESLSAQVHVFFKDGKWFAYLDDNQLFSSTLRPLYASDYQYSGLLVKQSTKSFFGKHWLYSIQVNNYEPDLSPPKIKDIEWLDSNLLSFTFNESIDTSKSPHFRLHEPGFVHKQSWASQRHLNIEFEHRIKDGNYTLRLRGLLDTSGNLKQDLDTFLHVFRGNPPFLGSIIINEILIDPTPSFYLPEHEYIELYNASDFDVQLENVSIQDDKDSAVLPPYILSAGSFLVLVASGHETAFDSTVSTLSMRELPRLNNDEDLVTLFYGDLLLDSCSYSTRTYKSQDKEGGGFALERINPYWNCGGEINWQGASFNQYGSPGLENTILDETWGFNQPKLLYYFFENDSVFKLVYSTPLHFKPPNITANQGIVNLAIHGSEVTIRFYSAVPKNTFLNLEISPLQSCAGIESRPISLEVAVPNIPMQGDLLFNEILFHVDSDRVEYLELHNNSNQMISLTDCGLRRFVADSFQSHYSLTLDNQVLMPNTTLCITPNKELTCLFYNCKKPENVFERELPSFPNQGSSYGLFCNDLLIDRFAYSEDMHHEFLRNQPNISLEKINPSTESLVLPHWTSASTTSGGGTPGYVNSQTVVTTNGRPFSLLTSAFSPNFDGLNDIITIVSSTQNNSTILSAAVFNLNGHLIKTLLSNQLVKPEQLIVWNGITDHKTKAVPGTYLIKIWGHDSKLRSYHFKTMVNLF